MSKQHPGTFTFRSTDKTIAFNIVKSRIIESRHTSFRRTTFFIFDCIGLGSQIFRPVRPRGAIAAALSLMRFYIVSFYSIDLWRLKLRAGILLVHHHKNEKYGRDRGYLISSNYSS
jgi:hypothetical protein